ncbi:hypothetical protein [Rhodococcoides fascians]|uniref:hypothetical protein n=1 Tax=Rhodococcoides fascians TaxID=1828 RepID=UPI00055DE0C4|nr:MULTISPECIES: hypothetical protein [Rhodococcus]
MPKDSSETFTSSVPLRMLIAGRIMVATSHLAAPTLVARFFGMESKGTVAVAYQQMFGIRNAALALGLTRLDRFQSPEDFIRLNIVMDAVDAVAWIAAARRKDIAGSTTVMAPGVALSAVAAGALALRLGRTTR